MKSIRIAAAVMICGATFGAAAPAAERFVWFGTYTRPSKDGPQSQGIYVSRFDDTTGALAEPVLAATVDDPSFLALHPSLPRLYSVCRVDDAGGSRPTAGSHSSAISASTTCSCTPSTANGRRSPRTRPRP